METVINFISETNNGGWCRASRLTSASSVLAARCPLSESSASRLRSINSRETLKTNDTRFSLSLTFTSASAEERKTSDAILCPFVLILRHSQHKYKRT